MPDRERVLAQLHELEQEDAEKDALVRELHDLLEQARQIQAMATGIQATQEELPERRQHAEENLHRVREEVGTARAALAEAEEAIRTAGEAEARNAELFEVRARDRLSALERREAEAVGEVQAVEDKRRILNELAVAWQAKGKALADELRNRPRVAEDAGSEPSPGLEGLLAWAEVAHAALFVARGQAMVEHDAVIRQANEIGAVALGEPLTSVSAAVVTRRVRQSLR